jgi:hypothetical protein
MAKIILKRNDNFKYKHVRFDADELENINRVLQDAPHKYQIISELETACDFAMGRQSVRANRSKRLAKLQAAASDFEKTLHEIQEFSYDYFSIDGQKNDIAATASKIRPDLIRLESLLASKKVFMRNGAGRQHSERALVLTRAVKSVFESFELPVSIDQAGMFFQILCACLEAIKPLCADKTLPDRDPARLIKKVLYETNQK